MRGSVAPSQPKKVFVSCDNMAQSKSPYTSAKKKKHIDSPQ